MLRYFTFILSLVIITLTPAYATKIALVIGNGAYDKNHSRLGLVSLDNPVNDAIDIATELRKLGFEVILKTNVRKKAIKKAVREFSRRLRQRGTVGLFFFSGHGFQYQNVNYLVPLKADIQSDIDIEDEAFKANYVLRHMRKANKGLNIMIFDACRNSIPKDLLRKNKGFFEGVSSGLTNMQAPINSLIAYATGPNQTSWGGLPSERNSIYTKHLLKALQAQAHFSITDLFIEVRNKVFQETKDMKDENGKKLPPQVPWESVSLMQGFCFGGCGYLSSISCVTDSNTGFVWYKEVQSKLPITMEWSNLHNYVRDINQAQKCGYNNWEVPSVEQLETLLINDFVPMSDEKKFGVFMRPIWTSRKQVFLNLFNGVIGSYSNDTILPVLLVTEKSL